MCAHHTVLICDVWPVATTAMNLLSSAVIMAHYLWPSEAPSLRRIIVTDSDVSAAGQMVGGKY
jgi:hypothetical protein